MSEMALAYARHKISVGEYHRMGDVGVFPDDARIELIDGELIETVAPMHPPHASGIAFLTTTFVRRLGDRASVRCQLPVTLGGYSEPKPDFAIVRVKASGYRNRHPGPKDIHPGYQTVALSRRGEELVPLAFPSERIAVDEILPPAA